jgi:hypothetical protein
MTSRHIMWALLVGSLPSCGGDSSDRTCLHKDITYAGSQSGAAYIRVTSDDGGRAYSFAGNSPSIQFMIAAESSTVICSRGGEPIDIPLTAVAWIDVSGAGAGVCADLLNPNPQCQPSPRDPQAHQTALLRFGQTTIIRIDVVDPP